jgi:hypothetical protein
MNKLIVVHAIKSLYVVAGYVKIRGKKRRSNETLDSRSPSSSG